MYNMPGGVVSEELLENNIIKCFSGLRRWQFYFGSNRTVMRGRVVELPNKWQNLYTLIFVVYAAICEAYFQMFYHRAFYNRTKIMFYSCFVGTFFVYFSYNSCLIAARLTNRDLNVKIYYMLQKIDSILQLTSDHYYTDFQATVQNRTNALILFLFPIFYSLHLWSIGGPICADFLIPPLLTVNLDTLLLYAFLYYIAVRLGIFNKMLKNHITKIGKNVGETVNQNSQRTLAEMMLSLVKPSYDQIDNILEYNRWSEFILQILKSYEMINEIFNYQMVIMTLSVFVMTLVGIAAMVAGYRTGLYPFLATVTLSAWATLCIIELTILSILADWITYQLKQTKVLCVRVMALSDYNDPYSKAASGVLRIIHYKKPKLMAYGVITVNTTLPLTIMGIVTTNVLVVIQYVVSRG